jgi:threonine/homoserine/homoserine lactone efflux protein
MLIGPVFFALLQNSIQKGFLAGAIMAFGIMLSDVFYIILCHFSLSPFLQNPDFPMYLGLSGGIIMLSFALVSIFKPIPTSGLKPVELGKGLFFKQLSKGFLLNGINPFVLIFWIGMLSYSAVDRAYSANEKFIFFSAIIVVVFMVDILKAYLAGKIRSLITPRFMRIMNALVGFALLIFGLRLIWFALA